MPRTRTEEDREVKMSAIVDAAADSLRNEGPAAFSVAAIARELDVAQNTIYWYFGSRDELFVAAMERLMGDMLSRKRELEMPLEEEIVWMMEELFEIAPLRAAVVAQAGESEVIAKFARNSRSRLREMLLNALRPRVEGDAELVADILVALVNGALQTIADPARRREVVISALHRFVGG